MHSAQLAQFNPTGWEFVRGPEQWAPAACFHQAFPRHGATAFEYAKVSDRLDAPEPDRLRLAAEAERSDQACSGHARERRRVGVEDVKGEATESVEQQFPQQAPVVHVEPFSGGDEHADISG